MQESLGVEIFITKKVPFTKERKQKMSKINNAIYEINNYAIYFVYLIVASYAFMYVFGGSETLAILGYNAILGCEFGFAVCISLIVLLALISCVITCVVPYLVSHVVSPATSRAVSFVKSYKK